MQPRDPRANWIGRWLLARCLAAALGLAAHPAQASDKGWGTASDIGRAGLVALALGLPVARSDWQGALQAGGSVAGAKLGAMGLKEIFPETRPDGSDRESFPSSHTAMSFAAAATLTNRHGWKVGLPAHLVAAAVGVGRVKARKHHWYDVVAGAAMGEAMGLLITTKRDASVRILPWGDSKGGGVAVAMRF